jgi:hypothetical protein
MGEIITANELISGATVYLAANGKWVETIDQARLFGPNEIGERDRQLDVAKSNNRLVGVEIETAEIDNGKIIADRLRERIRSEGPTAPRQPRQSLGGDDNVPV